MSIICGQNRYLSWLDVACFRRFQSWWSPVCSGHFVNWMVIL